MFSNALKSFTSNISSNYSLSPQPTSFSGPWKIYDAKKKSTGKAASVFVFEKKSLEPPGGGSLGGRSGASALKRAHEEVVERLKKEASSLARLRHPSVLELAEPVEETRGGGLMFATEPVTASLAGLLQEKDEQERAGGVGGRRSRYVVEESDGQKRRRELEIDELEIQKGLLQIAKGLEFLHESAGLVHANLTPEAIFINAKSDWKISGLAFCTPPENSTKPTSVTPISLSEVLNYDARLPRHVQLNVDYTSPDFVLDGNVTSAADMFSLGMLIIALYNSPHRSPLEFNGSQSAYKRAFSSSSSVPNKSNNFMSSQPLPRDVVNGVLDRLITRRPAQRLDAREFQQAQYFDNILVSTIRFLDSLPAKTPHEKSQFMRGLPRILNQFPKSVLEKKVLPALLEETKDRELLALVLQNIFKIVTTLPASKRAFTERVIPKLREVFLSSPPPAKGAPAERDSLKEAGLMVVLENINVAAESSGGKEFKDDILPIINYALESPTHSMVDAALRTLPVVVPILDFSTIKNELFPIIANVFAKTSSMGIKIRGLEAFKTLCGGGSEESDGFEGDGLTGVVEVQKPKTSNVSILDKYTIQDKVVPLLRGIKTKEPAVMMAALEVFKTIGPQVDSDFLAMDVLPILWQFSLGPLLNLPQFQAYMTTIKSMSTRVENEQTRKLQELGASNGTSTATTRNEFMSFGGAPATTSNGFDTTNGSGDGDFEALVRGGSAAGASGAAGGGNDMLGGDAWANAPSSASSSTILPSRSVANNRGRASNNASPAATFSWSTPPPPMSPPAQQHNLSAPQHQGVGRTITPDNTLNSLNTSFPALAPSNPGIGSPTFSQQQQQSRPGASMNTMMSPPPISTQSSGLDWSKASSTTSNQWGGGGIASATSTTPGLSNFSMAPQQQQSQTNPYSSFRIAPPPSKPAGSFGIPPPPSGGGTFSIAPPPGQASRFGGAPAPGGGMSMNSMASRMATSQKQTQNQNQNQTGWGANDGGSLI
ncbi:protein kinase-like protein Scy1 [Aaosphaeria arxii CBS 175.79]|uniref:Protein kinase-like protein Scy1 n=1 Tax=Aaosphaeria arxii CBS 175.79 TaxID=1450172 RepID=A0A6A5Y025_9PLEO|nr:protein kinase-like protein Scy1 [Aaosphaeria arxii CBS 175.79]KAF2018822.1 protein kinase-like protein Scy1 [Aaosphaeria arxii CBS 175.79]